MERVTNGKQLGLALKCGAYEIAVIGDLAEDLVMLVNDEKERKAIRKSFACAAAYTVAAPLLGLLASMTLPVAMLAAAPGLVASLGCGGFFVRSLIRSGCDMASLRRLRDYCVVEHSLRYMLLRKKEK